MEPLFGYTSADASLYKFARVADNHDIFYVEDGIVDLSKITQEVITAAPEPTIALHWLAINGIQPATPQNPTPVERAAMLSLPNTIAINLPSTTSLTAASTVSRREMHTKENTLADIAQRRPGQMLLFQADAVHSLTYEQYRCLESIIHFTRSGRLPETLPTIRMLLTQSGLAPLVPYLSKYVLRQATSSLRELPFLRAVLGLTAALVCSPYLPVEAHLHQLVPAVLTCLVAGRLGYTPVEPHWHLRTQASLVLSFILKRFRDIYHTLQPRVTRALTGALMDVNKSPATWYGCLEGLTMLGAEVVGSCVLPVAPLLLDNLKSMLESSEKREYKALKPTSAVVVGESQASEASNVRAAASLIAQGVDEVDEVGGQTESYGQEALICAVRPKFEVPWEVTCSAAKQMYNDANWTLMSLYRSLGLYTSEIVAGIYGENIYSKSAPFVSAAASSVPATNLDSIKQRLSKQVQATHRARTRHRPVATPYSARTEAGIKTEQSMSSLPQSTGGNYFATSPYVFTDVLVTHMDQLQRVDRVKQLMEDHLSGYLPSSMDMITQIIL